MKLVTINPQKSTTMGGVETLVRSLHQLFQCDNYELYEHFPQKEHYPESDHITFVKYGEDRKVASKLSQINAVKSLQLTSDDVVVLFHPNDLLYLPRQVLNHVKVVLVQTNKFSVFFKPLSKLVMALLHRKIDVFTVYTDQDKRALASLFPKVADKVKVIPRGCKLPTASQPKMPSNKLVTIARIDEEQKNFSAMIELMSTLPSDYSLDIYGDGTPAELSDLKSKIAGLANVQFKGPTSDVAGTLQEYAVFMMTSRYEGFGQTLIEARSQGLPIIAYQTFDALPWIVEDGINGYRIESGDSHQFITRIKQVCSDEVLYRRLSQNALSKAQDTELTVINRLWQEAVA
ncbi:glycosyltransferase [Vibrio renipiscarius]|uniref:Glycosyl transferase family 1 n=1 Tax=Vibrio renipiscarius TaxID=1461322 RepID=A0A0C2NSI4_9VIBR|nr:glycosyltransferase [Vibrio renipiscarius]KII76031.1 glycosyl transferase family 1 [Vibrio renipiscarius]KII79135.1 glycosyl transferase family 1 [Vibrio renipiscarius]